MVARRVDRQLCLQTSCIGDFLKLIPKSTTFPYEELKKRVFENVLAVQKGSEKNFYASLGLKVCVGDVLGNNLSLSLRLPPP